MTDSRGTCPCGQIWSGATDRGDKASSVGEGGRLRLGVRDFTRELNGAASQKDRPGALSSKKVSPPGGFLRLGREKGDQEELSRLAVRNSGLWCCGFTCPAGRDREGGTGALRLPQPCYSPSKYYKVLLGGGFGGDAGGFFPGRIPVFHPGQRRPWSLTPQARSPVLGLE